MNTIGFIILILLITFTLSLTCNIKQQTTQLFNAQPIQPYFILQSDHNNCFQQPLNITVNINTTDCILLTQQQVYCHSRTVPGWELPLKCSNFIKQKDTLKIVNITGKVVFNDSGQQCLVQGVTILEWRKYYSKQQWPTNVGICLGIFIIVIVSLKILHCYLTGNKKYKDYEMVV